jgi:hypothetical protein
MQLRQVEEKVIGGDTFEVTQLGAISGSKVLVRVLKILGPAFASKDVGKMDVGKMFEALQEDDLDYLVKAFGPMTLVKGKGQLSDIFDLQFAGKYKDMFTWLFFCLQLNYGDFLKGGLASAAVQAVAGAQASASTSPST